MKRFLSICLAVLALQLSAFAQDRAGVVCGPYLQNVTTNSFTVMWETDMDAVAWVEIAPDGDDHWYNRGRQRFNEDSGCGLLPIGRLHKVVVSGLEPGTTYRCRIMMRGVKQYMGPGNVSYTRESGSDVFRRNPFRVSTLKEDYDSVSFVVMNDLHEKDSLLRVLLNACSRTPDFVVYNGDMTSTLMDEGKIASCYMHTTSEVLAGSVPLFVFRGNHEFRGRSAILWPKHFSSATNKPYTAFRYGDFFFIGLDSGEDKPDNDIEYSGLYDTLPYLREEAEWLKTVLESEDCRSASARIVFSHIPPSAKGWQGNRNVRELFVPLLNKAGIDLMICGHEHRFRIEEAGSESSGATFPIWVNKNVERLEVSLCKDATIVLRSFDTDGRQTHAKSFGR